MLFTSSQDLNKVGGTQIQTRNKVHGVEIFIKHLYNFLGTVIAMEIWNQDGLSPQKI